MIRSRKGRFVPDDKIVGAELTSFDFFWVIYMQEFAAGYTQLFKRSIPKVTGMTYWIWAKVNFAEI
jgi:hypothetical protein